MHPEASPQGKAQKAGPTQWVSLINSRTKTPKKFVYSPPAGWFSSSGQEYLIFVGVFSVQATEKNGKYFVNICRQDGPTKDTGHEGNAWKMIGKCPGQTTRHPIYTNVYWWGNTIPLEMINEAKINNKNISHPCFMLVTHVALISLYK